MDDFSDEEIKAFLNSKLFKKWYAYKSLAQGIEALQEENIIYKQLLEGINRRVGGNLSQGSVEKVLNAFVREVNEYIELVRPEDDENQESKQ